MLLLLQCCAVAFIEKLNADSLSIRQEDFDRYMSGAAVPHDPGRLITTCEGLRLMRQNMAALVELRARQERLMAEALQLQQDMVDYCASTRDQVASSQNLHNAVFGVQAYNCATVETVL